MDEDIQLESADETLTPDTEVSEESYDELDELLSSEDEEPEEDSEALKKQAAKWREIAIRRKKKLQELSQKGDTEKKSTTKPQKKEDLSGRLDKYEFALDHKNLGREEVDMIFELAKVRGVSPQDVYSDKKIQKIIEEDAKEKRLAQASAVGSSATKSSSKSLIEKVQAGELSDEEFKANYKKITEDFSKMHKA